MDEDLKAELMALRAEIASLRLFLLDGVRTEIAGLRREVAAAIGKGTQLEMAPDAITTTIVPDAPAGKRVKTEEAAAALRIFEYWRVQLDHREAKFTPERKMRVLARLREYGEERVKRAILGCARSAFHRGENDRGRKYDDLELICRKGSHIERFEQLAEAVDEQHGVAASEPAAVAALRERAELALQEGKTDEYNEINERLRDISGDRRRRTNGKGPGRGAATPAALPRDDRRDH